MSHLAILCVRNEAAFLLEWLAHHRAVGFDDFLVFSNDCQDGTDLMLDRLQELGMLTHIRNDGPYDNGGIQFTALKHAAKLKQVKDAKWILPLDVDEFVNIHCGNHTLTALHAAIPDATAITLTWRLFGSNRQMRYSDTPVLDTFTHAAPAVMHWPWRAAMFKTLYRNNNIYKKPGVHRPRDINEKKLDQARWFDGNGAALPDQFTQKRIFSNFGKDNYGLVQLNHYPLGAMESYVLKADRGRAVHSSDMLGLDYWVERNFSTVEDASIHNLKAPRMALFNEMMDDPTLSQLHADAVQWRTKRFELLMQKEPFRALFGRLIMTPPSQPVPKQAAQFMVHHANLARRSTKSAP